MDNMSGNEIHRREPLFPDDHEVRRELTGKAVNLALAGSVTGMVGCNLIALVMSAWLIGDASMITDTLIARTGSPVAAMAVQTLLSGIYGAYTFAGILLYYSERLSLLKATIIHCAMIVIAFIPLEIYMGWTDFTLRDIAVMAGNQIIGFAIVWLIMDAKYRREVRELNELLMM